jgi:hypothetical protein
MLRKAVILFALALAVCPGLSMVAAAQSASEAKPVVATPDNSADFIGDWTLTADALSSLTVKVDAGKLVGNFSSDMLGTHAIAEMYRNGASLWFGFDFDYQGSPVPVVVTLTPSGDTVGLNIDFASGGYDMNGTATKKKS